MKVDAAKLLILIISASYYAKENSGFIDRACCQNVNDLLIFLFDQTIGGYDRYTETSAESKNKQVQKKSEYTQACKNYVSITQSVLENDKPVVAIYSFADFVLSPNTTTTAIAKIFISKLFYRHRFIIPVRSHFLLWVISASP